MPRADGRNAPALTAPGLLLAAQAAGTGWRADLADPGIPPLPLAEPYREGLQKGGHLFANARSAGQQLLLLIPPSRPTGALAAAALVKGTRGRSEEASPGQCLRPNREWNRLQQ